MEELTKWIPLLVPVAIVDLGLMIVALVDLVRREKTRGPKWAWALVIVLVNFVGPVIYLVLGREEQ
jgi:hypothetical protein